MNKAPQLIFPMIVGHLRVKNPAKFGKKIFRTENWLGINEMRGR